MNERDEHEEILFGELSYLLGTVGVASYGEHTIFVGIIALKE